MADSAGRLEAKALKLPAEDRARLAERLISSLDPKGDPDVDALWLRAAEQRLEELESGRISAVPADRVTKNVRNALR